VLADAIVNIPNLGCRATLARVMPAAPVAPARPRCSKTCMSRYRHHRYQRCQLGRQDFGSRAAGVGSLLNP